MKVAIIGCGIGGATLALALFRAGHEVRIFERALELKEVGAGIGLLTNAMRVLDSLSIGQQIRDAGHIFSQAQIWTEKKLLQKLDLKEIIDDAPLGAIIHRADLLSIILHG